MEKREETKAERTSREVPGSLSTNPPPNPRGQEHTDANDTDVKGVRSGNTRGESPVS